MPNRLAIAFRLILIVPPLALVAQENGDGTPEPVVVTIDELFPDEAGLLEAARTAEKEASWAEAVTGWANLLRTYPQSENRAEALLGAGRGYRMLGRFEEARQLLETYLKEFPKDKRQPEAHYLLGEMALAEEKWEEALDPLQRATRMADPEKQERAHYFRAIAAERLGELSKARKNLEALLKRDDGQHADYAALKLGWLEQQGGKQDEARKYYKKALSITSNADLRAEAAVRAGNLAFEEERFNDAAGFYDIIRRTESPKRWLELGHLGLIRSYYAMKDYRDVIRIYNEVKPAFPESLRPTIFFMTAESYRLTEQWKEASSLYRLIVTDFPDHGLNEAAAWGRILALQASESKELKDALVAFLGRYPESDHAPTAKRLRADQIFRDQDYRTAGPMYTALASDAGWMKKQNDAVREQVLFRDAFCASANEEPDRAVDAWTRFLEAFPDSLSVRTAWWLRAQAELTLGKEEEALRSLQALLRDHPDFPEREDALRDAAYLAGSLERYDEMTALFEQLLKEYPLQADKAEIQYWLAIGYQRTDQPEAALAAWKKARTLDREKYTPVATREIIRAALDRENLETVQEEVNRFDRWQEDHPQTANLPVEVYEWLGQELAEQDSPDAEPFLRRVLAVSEDAGQRKRTQLRLARLMSEIGRYGAAVREWKTYRLNHPEDADRFEISAPLLEALLETAAYDEAESMVQFLLRRYPEGNENARARLYLGDLERARGNPGEAAKIFRATALLIADPELTPLALYKAEQSYRAAGLDDEADEILLKLNKEYRDFSPPDADDSQ